MGVTMYCSQLLIVNRRICYTQFSNRNDSFIESQGVYSLISWYGAALTWCSDFKINHSSKIDDAFTWCSFIKGPLLRSRVNTFWQGFCLKVHHGYGFSVVQGFESFWQTSHGEVPLASVAHFTRGIQTLTDGRCSRRRLQLREWTVTVLFDSSWCS